MTARKITAPQKRALMGLRDRFRAEGLPYTESWLYVATLKRDTYTVAPGLRASSPVAMVRALAGAGAVEYRRRATGHRDGREVMECRLTPRGVDIINGRAG